MAAQSSARRADRAIAALAGRQHGAVGRWQLLAAGVTRHQIAMRLASHRLVEIHRGVYLVGHEARAPHAHEMAALLALRLAAVLSHRSAAALWDLMHHPSGAEVWLTVAENLRVERPGLRLCRARLDRRDRRYRHGMALTSPPRTILDLAAELDDHELERVVAEASFRGIASEAELREQLDRNPGKRGNGVLRVVLALDGGPRRTRSGGERLLLRLLREHSVTGYETNMTVHGYEVDFFWPAAGLVVEVDGYDAHSGRAAFERDRLKAAKLSARGITVMPVTGRQLRGDGTGAVRRIVAAIESASRPED